MLEQYEEKSGKCERSSFVKKKKRHKINVIKHIGIGGIIYKNLTIMNRRRDGVTAI